MENFQFSGILGHNFWLKYLDPCLMFIVDSLTSTCALLCLRSGVGINQPGLGSCRVIQVTKIVILLCNTFSLQVYSHHPWE